ncbi:hypothetical protein [Prosthecobacter fluviatilis]|uniref:Lipoprotein n=1 Tax=Prosthecobacter fluviatilis TaxID=445931 RepID=A0ABW0KV04_9BACT
MRRFLTRLLLLSAALGLMSCRSVKEEEGDSARFSAGNSFSSCEYILKGTRMSYYTIGYNGADRKRVSTRKLTPEELAAFWKGLEDNDVYHWRSKYEPSGEVPYTDPGTWDLTIHKGGKRVLQCWGFAAYPSDADPRKTTSFEETDRFKRMFNLFILHL